MRKLPGQVGRLDGPQGSWTGPKASQWAAERWAAPRDWTSRDRRWKGSVKVVREMSQVSHRPLQVGRHALTLRAATPRGRTLHQMSDLEKREASPLDFLSRLPDGWCVAPATYDAGTPRRDDPRAARRRRPQIDPLPARRRGGGALSRRSSGSPATFARTDPAPSWPSRSGSPWPTGRRRIWRRHDPQP